MFKLSPRLMACAEFIDSESFVDVGTDHAKLPIWSIKHNVVKTAFACDINEFSIKKSIKNVHKYKFDEKIKVFFSDGLLNVDEKISKTFVIAGLGGINIKNILEKCPWNKNGKKFILQPAKYDYILRDFLMKNGFEIIREKVVNHRNHTYATMLCEFSGKNNKFSDFYPFIGEIPKNSNSREYVKKQIRYLQNFLYGNNDINKRKIENIIKCLTLFNK